MKDLLNLSIPEKRTGKKQTFPIAVSQEFFKSEIALLGMTSITWGDRNTMFS